MLVNGKAHMDPNNIPLASLVAQEEHVDVNFIRNTPSDPYYSSLIWMYVSLKYV
jgi:hypothetical protein